MTCGIYSIKNIKNGKIYIGKSINIEKRFREHVWCLEAGNHDNDYLQKAWVKYGKENFVFEILEICKKRSLSKKEIHYIKNYKTKSPYGYNLTDGGDSSFGFRHSEDTKNYISELNKGRKRTKETNIKHSVTNKRIFEERGFGTRNGVKNKNTSSKYYGVSWNKRVNKWKVEFLLNGKNKFLGYFESEKEAAKTYDKYIIENNIDNKPINF